DQWAGRLENTLDVGRGHVLAGGVDDQLLLAVDDGQVPVLVEGADVAGVQPAVGVDRIRGSLGLVAVARHHDLAAHQHLAVVGQAQLDAGDRGSDGPDLDALRRIDRGDAGQLGHTPQLADVDPDGGKELEYLN